MKGYKILIITLLLAAISDGSTSRSFAHDKPDHLQFWIELEKKTFLVSEPIWIDMYVKNMDKTENKVKPLSLAGGWIQIVLINSENDTLKPLGMEEIEWVGEGPLFSIDPNETLFVCRNLLEETWIGEPEELGPGSWRTYLKVDTYRIKVIYKNSLVSNELTFRIVNPSGDEKTSYTLWKEGMENYGNAKWKAAITKWKELLRRYPKSVYAPTICRELDYYDRANSKTYAEKLLSNHPNSGYSEFAINVLLENKSKEEQEEILLEIEKKYIGTRAAKFVRNIRKGIIAY